MTWNDHDTYHHRDRGEPLDADTIARVKKLAEVHGSFVAARMLGVHSEAVARIAAGFSVYAVTREKVLAYFAKDGAR